MPQRGRAKRLVNAYAEFWPIKKLKRLPDIRGVYILYDRNYVPVYCGISGRGDQTVRERIQAEKTWSYYGKKIRYFSAYDFDRGYHRQIETLILHSIGHRLKWNTRQGIFLSGSIEYDHRRYK